jgi:peptide/nickel transport system permease protein
MLTYLLRRMLIAVLLAFVVSVLIFVLMRGLPGDPAMVALGESASAELLAEFRAKLGLDDPLAIQYLRWIAGVVTRWDFGRSLLNDQDVTAIIAERLPNTLLIGLPAIVLGLLLGLPVGMISAVRRGSLADQALTLTVNAFLGTPRFLIALFGVLVLGLKLRWIPLQGYTPPWVNFGLYAYKAIWPVFVNSIYVFAVVARHTRTNLVEVMNQDYIRTARANGLGETRILFGHALKNSLIPVITIIGLQMPQIVAGAVIVETIFNIPGIGQLVLKGVLDRDYLVVQAAVLVIAFVTIGSNLAVDLAYGLIDPRIRRGGDA